MPANESFWTTLLNSLIAQSGWEWLAAGLGIIYVILAAKESIWCWPAAFISTLIYTLLFWEGQLPMQALLNFYYLAMAIYGFFTWRHQSETNNPVKISHLAPKGHIIFLLMGIIFTGLIGDYLTVNDYSKAPYLDAAVTVFSVLNTLLMVRKIIESWLYWIIIDAAAIVLYYQTDYYATIIMMLAYLTLAIYGYKNWQQLHQTAQTNIN